MERGRPAALPRPSRSSAAGQPRSGTSAPKRQPPGTQRHERPPTNYNDGHQLGLRRPARCADKVRAAGPRAVVARQRLHGHLGAVRQRRARAHRRRPRHEAVGLVLIPHAALGLGVALAGGWGEAGAPRLGGRPGQPRHAGVLAPARRTASGGLAEAGQEVPHPAAMTAPRGAGRMRPPGGRACRAAAAAASVDRRAGRVRQPGTPSAAPNALARALPWRPPRGARPPPVPRAPPQRLLQ